VLAEIFKKPAWHSSDGSYYHADDIRDAVKNTSPVNPQPCEDAISRQAAIDAMFALCDTGETLKENPWRDNPHIDAVTETIERLPSVNPQHTEAEIQKMQELEQAEIQKAYELGKAEDPKTGHWIDIMVGDMPAQACDQCNTFYPLAYTGGWHNYCPNCGIKMIRPQERNDKE